MEDLTTMLYRSLEILFPSKSFHYRENRFAPALGQNFMDHKVCAPSVPSTCQTLMQSFLFSSFSMWCWSFLESTHHWYWRDHYHHSQCDMTCRVSNLHVSHEQIEGVTIYGAHHTYLIRHFNIFCKFSIFLLFLFLFLTWMK